MLHAYFKSRLSFFAFLKDPFGAALKRFSPGGFGSATLVRGTVGSNSNERR